MNNLFAYSFQCRSVSLDEKMTRKREEKERKMTLDELLHDLHEVKETQVESGRCSQHER